MNLIFNIRKARWKWLYLFIIIYLNKHHFKSKIDTTLSSNSYVMIKHYNNMNGITGYVVII